MKKIEIYTTNYCPFCVKAKSLLNKKKIKFSEIDVSNDEALREKMSAMAMVQDLFLKYLLTMFTLAIVIKFIN